MRAVLALFCLLSTASISMSAVESIDISKTKTLASKQEYAQSLQILSPCLSATLATAFSNLEECLYEGEHIVNLLIPHLQKEILAYYAQHQGKVFDFSTWPQVVAYKKLGLHFKFGHYGSVLYAHEFFQKLKLLFPTSKYRAEYEYRLIVPNIQGVIGWQEWEALLQQYLKSFPKGKYATLSRLDLAHIYDNLWDLIRSDNRVGYHQYFTTGDVGKDKTISEQYRIKSIKLYQTALKRSSHLEKSVLKKSKARLAALQERKPGYEFYILND